MHPSDEAMALDLRRIRGRRGVHLEDPRADPWKGSQRVNEQRRLAAAVSAGHEHDLHG